jgi:type I restriction-modification system DNA methylase subunit
MSIFQKSIVKKHISSENPEVLKTKWNLFTSYFHNATIQENIYNSKEEQFQEGFLRELFVKVLGYTLNPEPNFNLTTEYKNIKDSKKADGAIIINNIVTAVIELKGTATTDLGKVESQAFNYKNNQHQCLYVITSNFEKLRFYIDNAIEHIEFNLFKLSEEEFKLLYLCLAFQNIENNVPKNIKDESVSQEDVITKKLYNNYSLFKRELHHNLVALNPGNDPLGLFQKSQKLLDRFLFIFFAEDRGLLPTNLIFRINKEWQQLREMRIEVSLYDRYKIYFSDLNVGAKVSLPAFSQTASNKKEEFQIYAYNGGLFKEDDELNTLKIDDELLFKHTEKLSNYDFASEVDVNILGHIFENSLNELDEIKAQLEGQAIDKTKTKRKKDGVFYTPKYITKYIVDNTVGKLCTDKKVEFKILEEDYITDKKRNKTTIQNLAAKLTDYRNWLLQITICDPACGSGAFLNQALDFLINEHKYIDELQAKLFGDTLVLSDVEQSILENNIFGVDINEESVEIAKLSLWLRTAQPNRKLNDLNSNIKCGNSLIDDIAVAGDKAFNWNNEFKKIFDKGGFDVIIGNPPYVSNWTLSDSNRDMVLWLSENYKKDLTGHWDLFVCFISISIKYLKDGGYNSFILPTSFLKEKYGKLIRENIIENLKLVEIVDFGQEVIFENVARQTFIYNIHKSTPVNNFVRIKNGISDVGYLVPQDFYKKLKNVSFKTNVIETDIAVYNKLYINSSKLGEIVCLNVGVVAHSNTSSPKKFTKDDVIYNEFKDGFKKYVIGPNLSRYSVFFDNQFLDYDSNVNFFHRPKFKLLFESEKIIVRRTSGNHNSIIAYYDDQNYYSNDSMMHLIRWNSNVLNYQKPENKWTINLDDEFELKFLLVILCSKLSTYFFSKFLSTDTLQGAYSSIYPEDLREIPIKNAPIHQQKIYCEMSNLMLKYNNELQLNSKKFQKSILRKFEINDLPKKLQDWYLLSYSDFIKELAKKKIKLSLSDEAEWEEYFNAEAKKALSLKSKIDATDKEIDQLVYKLYDLTEEEIAIVEKV